MATLILLHKRKLQKLLTEIKRRCNNPRHPAFADYGGRGIKVCQEWSRGSAAFVKWANGNGYIPGLSIDRYPDKNGDYSPSNCRFATSVEQNRNTRSNLSISAFGETKLACEWGEDRRCVVTYRTFLKRFHAGWAPEPAMITPSHHVPQNVALEIYKMLKRGSDSGIEVADKFGVSKTVVYRIAAGVYHKAIGMKPLAFDGYRWRKR